MENKNVLLSVAVYFASFAHLFVHLHEMSKAISLRYTNKYWNVLSHFIEIYKQILKCLKPFHWDIQTNTEMYKAISLRYTNKYWNVLSHFIEIYKQILKCLKPFHGDIQTNAEMSKAISLRYTNKYWNV